MAKYHISQFMVLSERLHTISGITFKIYFWIASHWPYEVKFILLTFLVAIVRSVPVFYSEIM